MPSCSSSRQCLVAICQLHLKDYTSQLVVGWQKTSWHQYQLISVTVSPGSCKTTSKHHLQSISAQSLKSMAEWLARSHFASLVSNILIFIRIWIQIMLCMFACMTIGGRRKAIAKSAKSLFKHTTTRCTQRSRCSPLPCYPCQGHPSCCRHDREPSCWHSGPHQSLVQHWIAPPVAAMPAQPSGQHHDCGHH